MTLKDLIELSAKFVSSNIAVSMSLILVLAKLGMVKLVGDKETQIRNFLRIPEELAYIGLGFVLAGLSGDLKAFKAYFPDAPTASTWILLGVTCVICMWIHFVESRWVTPFYQRWRAADDVLNSNEQNPKKKTAAQMANYRRIWIHNFAATSLCYLFLAFAPAALWLWWIASIITYSG